MKKLKKSTLYTSLLLIGVLSCTPYIFLINQRDFSDININMHNTGPFSMISDQKVSEKPVYSPIGANLQDSPISFNSTVSINSSYLIITVSEYQSPFSALQRWKWQTGLPTYIETIDHIQTTYSGTDTPEKMRNCIIDYYNNYNTTWVLLGGDTEEVPTKLTETYESYHGNPYYDPYSDNLVGCDSYFADLDYNWDQSWGDNQSEWEAEPEVFVGRLSAETFNEMEGLINDIINYEKRPSVGDWMNTALFAGAMLYFDEDWDDDDEIDYIRSDANKFNNFVASELLPVSMNRTFLGEDLGEQPTEAYHDEAISQTSVLEKMEEGATIGILGGHANPELIGRTIFNNDYDGDGLFDRDGSLYDGGAEIDQSYFSSFLDNNADISPAQNARGVYILDGCSAGTFKYYGWQDSGSEEDCLAEMLLKQAAIGVLAGFNVVWGEDEWYEREHGGWFMEGLTFRFIEQLMLNAQPGKALGNAKHDLVLDRQNATIAEPNNYPGWEEKILKQYNLLGDPEVSIWLGVPDELNYSITNYTENNIISVYSESTPISNATITLIKDDVCLWMGETNATGEILIPITNTSMTGSTLTISKEGYLPNISRIGPKEIIPAYTQHQFAIHHDPQYEGYALAPATLNISWTLPEFYNPQTEWVFLDVDPIANVSTYTPINTGEIQSWIELQFNNTGIFHLAIAIANRTDVYYSQSIPIVILDTANIDPQITVMNEEFEFIENNLSAGIHWKINDNTFGYNPNYTIYQGNSVYVGGRGWENGEEIEIRLTNQAPGNYSYALEVFDGAGGYAFSEVEITLTKAPFNPQDLGIAGFNTSVIFILMGTVWGLLYKKKRNVGKISN